MDREIHRKENGCFSSLEGQDLQGGRLEEELRRSRETAESLLNASWDRALLLDAEGRILGLNRTAAEALGGSVDELVGKNAFDLFPPEIAADRRALHEEAVRTGRSLCYEDRRDGHWLETRLQPIRAGERGGVSEVAVFSRDVTEYKEAQEALRRNRDYLDDNVAERTAELSRANKALRLEIAERREIEERLRLQKAWLESLVHYSSFGIVTLDRDCIVVSCNESFVRLFGFGEEELLGFRIDDLITCERCRKEAQALTAEALEGNLFQCTAERHRKDGSSLDVEIFGVPVIVDGQVIGGYGVYREISDLKAAEEALRESEELFRIFAEDAPFGMSIMNADMTFEYFNPKFTEIFGYTLEDLPDKATWFREAYPEPKYQEMVQAIWTRDSLEEMKMGEVKPRIFTVRCKDGRDKTIHFRAVILKGQRQLMTYEDITARARVQEALRQSEERYRKLYEEATRREELYRSLLQSSPDAVIIYDLEGTVQYVSPAFSRLFGWTLDELAGKRIPFVPESERERTMELIRALHDDGTPCSGFETLRSTKSGNLVQVSVSASRYDDHQGNPAGMLVMLRDISGRKELEAQLSQAHKMEAIGTLAGGIAHDFNNILQAISGYTQLLLMKKNEDHPDHAKLAAIDRSARRAGELTERLLIFGRKVESRLRPVDLNHEVQQVVMLLERTIPKMIHIQTDLADGLRIINGDPVQLEQVAMNMAVNARDAMPDGGTLTFRTRNILLGEEHCRLHPGADAGQYVLLEVMDTGHGMDPMVLDHIYEPFFTTKATGKGTGLGLAMVYGIVKSHGATINCTSRRGAGTTFRICFPVLSMDDVPDLEEALQETTPGGRERILLVDDEESILEIACDILERYGYRTVTAGSGEDALKIYDAEEEGIDLVILDLNMPGMGGSKCLRALREINPAARVVVATGHTSKDRAGEALSQGAARFIPKPYRLKDLLRTVREALDEVG
ncbi:MAG: PAS domain S-box protein [Deltaproteobacteria bacterium]|nr:PAS domain S-box protein [Deltaproteobacteria bacterium]